MNFAGNFFRYCDVNLAMVSLSPAAMAPPFVGGVVCAGNDDGGGLEMCVFVMEPDLIRGLVEARPREAYMVVLEKLMFT